MAVELNIFDISRQPFEYEEVRNELSSNDHLGEWLTAYRGDMNLDTLLEQADAMLDLATTRETVIEGTTDISSTLPDTLKYKYLDPSESLPVIISSDLDKAQEQELLNILREYKEVIRWSIGDTKGINLAVVIKLLDAPHIPNLR
jgi:hypothetical protein